MKNFHLLVATPAGKAFDGEATQLSVMGECGSLSILAGHIPFITNIKAGKCRIYTNDVVINCSTLGGLLSVTKDCVRLITTSMEIENGN